MAFTDQESLLETTAKVKYVREEVTRKLEQYREQYEEMHIRALTAELEVTSLQMKLDQVARELKSQKGTVIDLVDQIGFEKGQRVQQENALEITKEKLSKLRTKLRIEFDKMLKNQKDLRICVNSFMRCIFEFRTSVITKDDFLCAVDLIFSSLVANDSMSPTLSPPWNQKLEVLFNSHSIQELASLPPEQRRKKLELFIDRLSPDLLFSKSTDILISEVFEEKQPSSQSPPPLPIKPKINSFKLTKTNSSVPVIFNPPPIPPKLPKHNLSSSVTPPSKIEECAHLANGMSFSDSDSDFEGDDVIRNIRRTNRALSEGKLKVRISTVNEQSTDIDEKKPKKERNAPQRQQSLHRTKSCDQLLSDELADFRLSDSSDGSPYSIPFEHVQAWRKFIGIRDSSILTGSLTRLHNSKLDEESLYYISPNEFRSIVSQVRGECTKMGLRTSQRVMKRVDSYVKSRHRSRSFQNDYLSLIDYGKDNWLQKIKSKRQSKKTQAAPTPPKRKTRLNYENQNNVKRKPPSQKKIPSSISMTQPKSEIFDNPDYDTALCSSEVYIPPNNSSMSPPKYYPLSRTSPPNEFTYERHSPPIAPPRSLSPQIPNKRTERNRTSPLPARRPLSPQITTTRTRTAPIPLPKPDIKLQTRGSEPLLFTGSSSEGSRPPALLPKPLIKPKPSPRQRHIKGSNDTSEKEKVEIVIREEKGRKKEGQNDENTTEDIYQDSGIKSPFPDQIPTYSTLKHNTRSLRVIPIIDPICIDSDEEDSEEDPGDYSLGIFEPVMNSDTYHINEQQRTTTYSSSDSSDDSDNYQIPPDATPGYIEPHDNSVEIGRDRSYTTNLPCESGGKTFLEKQGYMHKLDPRLKHWTRRWFVLKGKELKYYSKKATSLSKAKGVINLETWCRITRHEMTSSFQLATPSRTYHFVADSNAECEEWIKALQTVLRVCQGGLSSSSTKHELSGWAKIYFKNSKFPAQSMKVWISLLNQTLQIYNEPNGKSTFQFPLSHAMVRHGTDVPAGSRCRSSSSLFSGSREEYTIAVEIGGAGVQQEGDDECVTISLGSKEDRDLWFYHLTSASSGESGPELTLTEKLIARIWRTEKGGMNGSSISALWSNPILNFTSEKIIQESLVSHPSASLASEAVEMFKVVNLFITTKLDSLCLEYHILSLQQLTSQCLIQPELQDELYCQVLRQVSGTPDRPISYILQSWYLLALLIPIFLPTRKLFRWYLEAFLNRFAHSIDKQQTTAVVEAASLCQHRLIRAETNGPREKKPSWFELHYLMSGPIQITRIMQLKLQLPVNLMNDTTLTMEFDSSTTVQECVSQLNQEIGMPDTQTTGFALMSDWPGEDDVAGFYLFPSNKLCDVISTWTDSLTDLGSSNSSHGRTIQLTYRNRLSFRSRRGMESDKETLLLVYQISKDILSDQYYIASVDLALDIAARMAQVDYGNCESLTNPKHIAKNAVRRFCPMRYTKMILPHDLDVMSEKLLQKWSGYHGVSKNKCVRSLLSLFADSWTLFGATLFYCKDKYSVLTPMRNAAVWLAVHEDGVSLLHINNMKLIIFYKYKEVATFGGHGEDFMLVINSQQKRISHSTTSLQTEKIILSMPKVKIREATYLMASYLDARQ